MTFILYSTKENLCHPRYYNPMLRLIYLFIYLFIFNLKNIICELFTEIIFVHLIRRILYFVLERDDKILVLSIEVYMMN
jgi:hypothetical protein